MTQEELERMQKGSEIMNNIKNREMIVETLTSAINHNRAKDGNVLWLLDYKIAEHAVKMQIEKEQARINQLQKEFDEL